jgi:acyl phosphate:glycerol-3-phosphate acyltransferase
VEGIIVELGAAVLVAALSGVATRNPWAAGMVTFSYLAAVLCLEAANGAPAVVLYGGCASAALLAASAAGAARGGVFRFPAGIEVKPWRIVARPFALLFIPIDALWGHRVILIVVGAVAIVFIVSDLARIFFKIHSSALYKKKERRAFSSMTAYLVAVFIVFLLFPRPVSWLSLAFLTIGDLYGKLIGIRFGRTRLVGTRTLEGSLGYVTGALVAGTIMRTVVDFPVLYLAVGTIGAAAVELFSRDIDDNLTVGLLSGALLSVVKLFFRV